MKKNNFFLICLLILFLQQFQAMADDITSIRQPRPPSFPDILPASQQRALEQRADQVIEIYNALIQTTIQANSGNYFHQGKSKILIFNNKIYKDFTLKVINGNHLIINTEDGTFQMDVLDP